MFGQSRHAPLGGTLYPANFNCANTSTSLHENIATYVRRCREHIGTHTDRSSRAATLSVPLRPPARPSKAPGSGVAGSALSPEQ